jgi:hypothetical protein
MLQLFTDNENPESWMKHAKGLGQLIKIRGPDRYRNQVDITLLKASRGLVVRITHLFWMPLSFLVPFI